MSIVHIISKHDNSKHASFGVDPGKELPKLADSSIRVRTSLISLTSNNLTYARAGTPLHWWDTFPVPATAPASYANAENWGILPAWGYGEVLESTLSIPVGTTLWGFWPTSSLPVDLQLEPAEPAGHWIDTSPHRTKVMSYYQRYTQVKDPITEEEKAKTSLYKPVWVAGFALDRYVFTTSPSQRPPTHPFGTGNAWTTEDADLTNAVVVNLSAASKTARGFLWQLAKREMAQRPLGILNVTNSPSSLPQSPISKPVSYASLSGSGTLDWIKKLAPRRLVILDFGGPTSIANSLTQLNIPTTTVGIGSEPKVYSPDELKARMQSGADVGMVRLNTSGVREVAIANEGPEAYFEREERVWGEWLVDGEAVGTEVEWGEGVRALEEGWEGLCRGEVPGARGLVYRL